MDEPSDQRSSAKGGRGDWYMFHLKYDYTYDYGARQYNPVLARWDRVDPLCEKYYSISPYAYCGNNPVNRVDKDGRLFDTFLDGVFFLYDVADAGYQLISSGSVSNTTMAAFRYRCRANCKS